MFSINGTGPTGYPDIKGIYHISHTYINVNTDHSINVKLKIINFEKKTGTSLYGLGFGKDFLNMTPNV